MSRLAQTKTSVHSTHLDADSDLMHHQHRLSVPQWNPGPARKNPTHILAAACGRFHAVILQEASDHAPRVSDQFIAYNPVVLVFTISEASSSKDMWRMAALVVRGLLRRPSLSGSPTVTFCSVHVHNKVAKKRDASTSLLQRLYAHMVQHNVDFIGGDFNMSAFSTVGGVFSDPEFRAPGNALLWGVGGLDDSCKDCTSFLIMPKRPYDWRVDAHGCYKFDNADLGFAPRDQTARFPVFLHLRVTNLPGPDSITRSSQAQQRRMERAAGQNELKRIRKQLPVTSKREH